jgi:hypothetical protein
MTRLEREAGAERSLDGEFCCFIDELVCLALNVGAAPSLDLCSS